MARPKFNWTRVREQSRIYYFADGEFRVDGVVRIAIPGTTHRLETKPTREHPHGRKLIVRCGWHAIEIIGVKEWSK